MLLRYFELTECPFESKITWTVIIYHVMDYMVEILQSYISLLLPRDKKPPTISICFNWRMVENRLHLSLARKVFHFFLLWMSSYNIQYIISLMENLHLQGKYCTSNFTYFLNLICKICVTFYNLFCPIQKTTIWYQAISLNILNMFSSFTFLILKLTSTSWHWSHDVLMLKKNPFGLLFFSLQNFVTLFLSSLHALWFHVKD